jgi:hypothetical protein
VEDLYYIVSVGPLVVSEKRRSQYKIVSVQVAIGGKEMFVIRILLGQFAFLIDITNNEKILMNAVFLKIVQVRLKRCKIVQVATTSQVVRNPL